MSRLIMPLRSSMTLKISASYCSAMLAPVILGQRLCGVGAHDAVHVACIDDAVVAFAGVVLAELLERRDGGLGVRVFFSIHDQVIAHRMEALLGGADQRRPIAGVERLEQPQVELDRLVEV